MSSSLADSAAPADTSLIRSRQVSPLPVGPGGKSPAKRQMNDTNTQLTMLMAQSAANTKYDPPVPQPITKQVTLEKIFFKCYANFIYHFSYWRIAYCVWSCFQIVLSLNSS